MPLSTAAKAALCICPPALMAGTVATVPTVKRAVHHLTEHHAAKPVHRIAAATGVARPQTVARQPNCDPGLGGGPLPAVPLVTYASPIADEPAGSGIAAPVGAVPVVGALGLGTAGGGAGVTPVTPVVPDPGAVPEPSVWLMLIAGVGTLGGALRRRHRRSDAAGTGALGPTRKATFGGALWSGSAAVEAGDMATTVAMKSAVAGAAGKALLCVCPAVLVAGSVMTVPPLRQAVHAATLAPEPALPAMASGTLGAQPCAEATVPVSTAALDGFPASVEIPASPPVKTAATAAAPIVVAEPAANGG